MGAPESPSLDQAWRDYHELIEGFKDLEQPLLASHDLVLDVPQPPDAELTNALVERSEAVEAALEFELRERSEDADAVDRLGDFAVAVAALDILLGADILRLTISRAEWRNSWSPPGSIARRSTRSSLARSS